VELHATCTVGEFNKSEGIVRAKDAKGSPPIVAVTMIEAMGSSCVFPVEVVLDHGTTLFVSPVASTYPEPKSETQTWLRRKDERPGLRVPLIEKGSEKEENVEYVTESRVVHSNHFYLRATDEKSGILEPPSAPLVPFLNVMVFDSIKIKDLHEDTVIQVVGYNIEITNEWLTSWAYH